MKQILLLFLAAGLCSGQRDVAELFSQSCAPCHGKKGEGALGQTTHAKPPDLTRGVYKSGTSDEDLARVISRGVAESGMPAFEQLGEMTIRGLVHYVRSLAQSQDQVPGNASSGEKLFWGKANCGKCHAIGSKGIPFGPDLTVKAGQEAAKRLRKAILDPEDDITQGFEMVTIVLNSGETVTGLPRFFDNFSTRIIDSTGAERTFLRSEVRSMRREMKSFMPVDYGKRLSAAEVDDVVAYLVKLQNEAKPQ